MKSLFQEQSIKNKLTTFSMVITGAALFLACLSFSIYDVTSIRKEMVKEIKILADMIGKNCTAALSFQDKNDAAEILSALNVHDQVIWAGILDKHGNRFATYEASEASARQHLSPSLPSDKTHDFREGLLTVRKPIMLGNEVLGEVYIVSDLGELYARIRTFVVILLIVFTISSLAAFLIARKLHDGIAEPILQLTRTAKLVSDERDYSVRATKYSDDELGFLTERFNEMLGQIQERNNALQEAHDKMEKQATKLREELKQRKRLQSELARAQRLETAGRIAGQIAHDFNNLLGPLAAYPTLVRDDLPADHAAQEMLAEMEASACKIAEINQQLLALGRRGHYTQEVIDLNGQVQKVLTSLSLPREIQVKTELASDLFCIKGGSAQLVRALNNIISNAVEAMHFDGVLTVRTENIYIDNPLQHKNILKRGEYVRLEISDTGDGIDQSHLDKIFDPFFTTKTMDRMRGSGLGLSVVHGVMQDHHGHVTVDSTPGKGTTFSLFFPIVRDLNELPAPLEEVRGGNESILVVDDDPIQRKVNQQILNRLGYQVHAIASGEQAVEYVKEHPQDLLLLDMLMEGIDGTETYKRILQFRPDQRALLLSGYAKSKRVEQAIRLGAGSFIAKPISMTSLATAVRKELDQHQNNNSD